jgi:para-nitrobenzyl esterase
MGGFSQCDRCIGPVVEVRGAEFLGDSSNNGDIVSWRGIPYATAERFGPPFLISSVTGEWKAEDYGPACAQWRGSLSNTNSELNTNGAPGTPDAFGGLMSEEGCLGLNISRRWNGEDDPSDLPVYVWFHGGAFARGSTRETFTLGGTDYESFPPVALLDGREGIAVTVNYRLGPLGFLTHPDLDAETGISGTYGLQDATAALYWISQYIDEFGGDPDNVTVIGESAGGILICQMLTSPLSEHYIDQAVLMSGSCLPFSRTIEEAQALNEPYVEAVVTWATGGGSARPGAAECGGYVAGTSTLLDCLRAVPAAQLLRIATTTRQFQLFNVLSVDWVAPYGEFPLPVSPQEYFADPDSAQVPLLVMNTGNEMGSHNLEESDAAAVAAAWKETVGLDDASWSEIEALYEIGNGSGDAEALIRFVSDIQWDCPSIELLQLRESAGVLDLWRARFDVAPRAVLTLDLEPAEGSTFTTGLGTLGSHAGHGTDVGYLFGHDDLPDVTGRPADRTASFGLRRAIYEFATNGAPAYGPTGPPPTEVGRWTNSDNNALVFGPRDGIGNGFIVEQPDSRSERCSELAAILNTD